MFGIKLKTLRKARGMTQQQLGDRLGVSASAIGMYEQDRRKPDHDTLKKMCLLFEVPSDYFLMEEHALGGPFGRADNSDVSALLQGFFQQLRMQDGLMFDQEPLTDQDVAQLIEALEIGARIAMEKKNTQKKKS